MLKVAISGNIASGKSTVQNILSSIGYKVIDTDIIAENLRKDFRAEIVNVFSGFDILSENGEISRRKLGNVIFNDKNLKEKLEKFMHPKIRNEVFKFFDAHKDEKFVFVGIPLLFETGMDKDYDKIIFVHTDDEIRLERLIKRNGYTLEYAKKRIESQMPQNEKELKSDYVINNNGSVEELRSQILEILSKLG